MRICERKDGKPVKAILRNLNDGSEYDLCKECLEEFTEWLSARPREQKPAEKKGGSK